MPIEATDTDTSDSLLYSLSGTDARSFTIVSTSGQLKTKTGVTYDFETKTSYSVIVGVSDGNGGSDSITVTINISDVNEPPSAPAAPMVTSGSTTTSLSVSWTDPTNTGPDIMSYDLQYRQGTTGNFTTGPQTVTGTRSSITGLTHSTRYQVQVRATNAEGTGSWSASGDGTTNTPTNNAPTFTEGDSATRSLAENTVAGENIGTPIAATDTDGDTLTYTLGGTDANNFDLVTTDGKGQLRTKSGVTYNHETKASHAVTVGVSDGNSGSDSITVTINISDVEEPPGPPAAPAVSAVPGSPMILRVTWRAPATTGPAITSYALRYREGDSGDFTNGPQTVTGTSTTITGLIPGTRYQVQVRATNAEGDSPWSPAGAGTSAAPPPVPDGAAPPAAPVAPAVSAVPGSPTSLRVTWRAPATPGPAITSYDLQYRAGTSGPFTAGPQTVTGTHATITGLTPGTRYQVQVRATNADGVAGPWSPAGAGTTSALNTPPVFASPLADQRATEGLPFTYVIPTADGDRLTYAATTRHGGALPEWLTFDRATRTFTGTPSPSDIGPVTVTVTASDGRAVASDEFILTVLLLDPSALPEWLSRFGRTVGTHVTDAVGARLRGAGGTHVTVGGVRLPMGQRKTGPAEPGAAGEFGSALVHGVASLLGVGPTPAGSGLDGDAGSSDRAPRVVPGQTPTLNLDLRRILLGSAFQLPLSATDTPAAPRLTAWGRVAGTQFTGREGAVAAEGDVLTGTVGVDGAWARWLAGLAVAHSRGDGTSRRRDSGAPARADLGHSLTSLHPYLRYAVNDRLDVWGLLGYGWGEVTVAPEPGQSLDTATQLAMGAFGGRGQLVTATANGGLAIATRTEALFTHLTSEAGAGLAAADAAAHRLRVVLEGSRRFTWEAGQSLTPAIEVGVRRDWGDAETGFGLELGGRMQYADPAGGFLLEGALRGLVAHEDEHYGEWGASGALRIEPGPAGQGLSLTLAPTWGAVASGVQGLWTRQTTAGLAPQSPVPSPGGQVALHLGYGLWVPALEGLVTPFTGGSLTDAGDSRARAGVVVDRRDPWGGTLRLELAGEWLATPGRPPDQTIGFQVHLSFGHGSRGRGAEGVSQPSPGRDPDRPPPGAPDRGRLPTPFRVR